MSSLILSCFLVPKPFRGHAGLIQENALACLAALGIPTLLLGDEEGVAEAASRHGARHVPEVSCNERGTPLVSAAFDLARRGSDAPYLCYLNADILLPRGFLEILSPLLGQAPDGLFTGRRWNLDIREVLTWDTDAWRGLEARRIREGRCPGPFAMDYFVFPREAFQALPPFAIGRPGWDNWMIHQARAEGRPVVDLSPMLAVIHQDHDFNHLLGGEAEYRNGSESLANRRMAGGYFRLFTLEDATHRAVNGRVTPCPWRFPFHAFSRWVLGSTTNHPRLRGLLRAIKRRLAGFFP